MPGHVFVYGSLLADEVVSALLDRVPKTQPAVIHGYTRHSIKQRIYPAIVKASDSSQVHGRVLCELSEEELNILDDFEDEDYYRGTADAELQDGTTLNAALYVWQDAHRHLLHGSWDYDEFRRLHLRKFLGMMEEWETSAEFPEDTPADAPRDVS